MRKHFLLLMTLVFMLCLSVACTPAGTTDAAATEAAAPATASAGGDAPVTSDVAYKEEIVIAPTNGFSTQDVQNCGSVASMSVYFSVFNTLADIDVDTGKLVPDLALSWEPVSDTVWQFKLREGVTFHDGTPFTAEDVKFTIERGLEQAKTKVIFAGVKSVTVVDDYTVEVETESPNHDFVNMIVDPRASILSKKAFETLTPEEANQIGTGAYQYAEWVEGDHVTLVRNDNYWGELPKTQRIVIKTMMEATTRMVALETGEVDLIQDPLLTDIHYLDEGENLKLLQYTGAQVRFFCLNTSVAPLDNPLVRKAIAYGMNREDYLTVVYENYSGPHYNFQHPSTEYYIDGEMGVEYNPEKAKELLKEAGYADGLTLDLLGPQEDRALAINTIFQSQMADIGIKMNSQNLETMTFVNAMETGDYTIGTDWTSQYFQGIDKPWRTFFYAPAGTKNYFGFSDEHINQLIDAGRGEFDETKRSEIYTELQNTIMNEEFCVLPVCIEPRLFGATTTLEGLPTPGSAADYTYVYVTK